MMQSVAAPETNASLPLLESGITLLAIGLAWLWPKLGAASFSRAERALSRFARRRFAAVLTVGLTALLLRLAILPLCHIPLPFCTDDFSFLLAAQTFLHGRLTNPTPAMWTHLETIHVSMLPTYGSMYFPAQALVLAAGQLLFGHPWLGILASSALMCAAICWMLQAWLPATWAFLGGMIAVLHLGLFSYWVNSYHSAGTIGALGGALILGALPRALKTAQLRYWMALAAGISILILARPYEALLLCLPVAWMILRWMRNGRNRPAPRTLALRAAMPLALIAATLCWLGYYDHQAFGKATTLPYTVNRATYAMAPYFIWQQPRPEPNYRHEEMRRFYHKAELDFYKDIHSRKGFLLQTSLKATFTIVFLSGTVLLLPVIMIGRVFRDRRTRFLLICLVPMSVGMVIQIFIIPHYVASYTAAFYAIGLQAMRHLRLWKPEGRPMGLMLVRMTVPIILLMAGLRTFAGPLNFPLFEWAPGVWNFRWYGPGNWGQERASVATQLQKMEGRQLVIVHYAPNHHPTDEWVYNEPDVDSSKVIWAQDMGEAGNAELLSYYKDRRVWLATPDNPQQMLAPYAKHPEPQHTGNDAMFAANAAPSDKFRKAEQ